jgi:metal-sulfur cluster biosynthetic enzyme
MGIAMVTEAAVRKALRQVKDPEMNLDLVVLGLIYDIRVNGSHVDVTMSLTSPGCPVAGQILEDARAAVEKVEGVESAEVELTFSPPWTADRIPPTIRAALGL